MRRRLVGNSVPAAIDRYINSAYDNVLLVAENIEAVKKLSEDFEYLSFYLGAYSTPPTERPNGDPLVTGDFYFNDGSLFYYDEDGNIWSEFDPDVLLQASADAVDAAVRAEEARDAAVDAEQKAYSLIGGTDIGDYEDDPTFNNITDYVVFGRGTSEIALFKVEENVDLPYTVDSTANPHPTDDDNLRAYTSTATMYTYEETTYLTDGQVVVDATSELKNYVVYLWDSASGERERLDVVYDYTTNNSNQIVLTDTYPVGSIVTIVFEDIGQSSDTYLKKQEAEQKYGDHNKQANRGSANSHPASAISTTNGVSVQEVLDTIDVRFRFDGEVFIGSGNITDHVGESLVKGDLVAYQYPDDSGEYYVPVQSQSFPITIPTDPTVTSSGWSSVSDSKYSDVTVSGTTESLIGELIEGQRFIRIKNESDSAYVKYEITPIPRSTRTIASIDMVNMTITQNPSDTCKLTPVTFDDDSLDQIDLVKWKSRKNSRLLQTNGNSGIKSISVMGDSISHGAFSGDVYRNNWTNIVKRLMLDDLNQESYGFVSLQWPLTGAGVDSMEIIGEPLVSGFSSKTHLEASHTIAGFAYQSVASGSTISFSAPSTQQFMSIWYSGAPKGAGTFDVYVNGVLQVTVDTSLNDGATFTYVTIEDNGRGECDIVIEATSNSVVEIQGICFGVSSLFRETFNNFSQAGRRLAYVDDEIIEKMCQSQILIMSLGHNDQPYTGDPTYDALFSAKIDALIQYCNQYKCQLYINNFVWDRIDRSLVPRELKRLHQNVYGSKLLAWNEMLDDGEQVDGNYLVNTIQLWDDGSHPNIDGHEMIGEVVAQKMKLGGNTKNESLRLGLWFPLKLEVEFLNSFTSHELVSAARLTDGNNLRLSIKNQSNTTLASYTDELICKLPSSDYYPSYSIDERLYETRNGVVTIVGNVRIATDGSIKITTDSLFVAKNISLNITLPIK